MAPSEINDLYCLARMSLGHRISASGSKWIRFLRFDGPSGLALKAQKMSFPPFEGPRRKIERARKHIEELRNLLDDFDTRCRAENARIEFVPYDDPQHEDIVFWRPRFTHKPPEDVPLLIGDAIHNMRAALDITVCDVARIRGLNPAKMKFPFAEDQKKLDEILKQAWARSLGAEFITEIKRLAPYKGGNLGLRWLHDLDIIDKHLLIIPTYLMAKMRNPYMEDVFGAFGINLQNTFFPLTEHATLRMKKGLDPTQFLLAPPDGPQCVFPENGPFPNNKVLPTLVDLSIGTDELINLFDEKFSVSP